MGLTVHASVVNFVLVRSPAARDQAKAAERFLAGAASSCAASAAYGMATVCASTSASTTRWRP